MRLVGYSMMHVQQFDAKVKIVRWVKLNSVTVALSTLLYVSARLTSFDSLRSEYIAFTPVVIIRLIDLKEMLQTFNAAA